MKTLAFTKEELELIEKALRKEADERWNRWARCEDNGWIDSAERHYAKYKMCDAIRDRINEELEK